MKNKEMFDLANATNDDKLKKLCRERFLEWCGKHGRTPMNPMAVQDWWRLEWSVDNV